MLGDSKDEEEENEGECVSVCELVSVMWTCELVCFHFLMLCTCVFFITLKHEV